MTTTISAAQYNATVRPGLIKRKIKNRPEEDLQKALVKHLDAVLPLPPRGPYFFHVPNTAKRSFQEGKAYKEKGVRAGVPDLIFIYKGKVLAIELKAPLDNGRPRETHQLWDMLSDAQQLAQSNMELAGATIRLADTFDTAVQHIRDFGIPFKSR